MSIKLLFTFLIYLFEGYVKMTAIQCMHFYQYYIFSPNNYNHGTILFNYLLRKLSLTLIYLYSFHQTFWINSLYDLEVYFKKSGAMVKLNFGDIFSVLKTRQTQKYIIFRKKIEFWAIFYGLKIIFWPLFELVCIKFKP